MTIKGKFRLRVSPRGHASLLPQAGGAAALACFASPTLPSLGSSSHPSKCAFIPTHLHLGHAVKWRPALEDARPAQLQLVGNYWKFSLRMRLTEVVGSALSRRVLLHASALALSTAPVRHAVADTPPVITVPGAFATISEALQAAAPGARIAVGAGTYRETCTIRKPLQLVAAPGARPVVELISDQPYQHALTIDVATDAVGEVLVEGFELRHTSPSIAQNYAVYSASTTARSVKAVLRDLDITSSSGTGVGVEGGEVELLDSRVRGCKGHGLAFLGERTRGVVRGCTVAKCKLNGALVRDGAAPQLDANVFEANGLFGVSQIDCAGALGEGNTFRGNGKGAVFGECDREPA